MKRRIALMALLLAAPGAGHAAAPVTDPDWPCMQRLIPTLTPGTYWAGPAAAADWQADPRVAALVDAVAPRRVPAEDGSAKLAAFVSATSAADRPRLFGEVFSGLVAVTNEERSHVIARLKELNRRQREIGAIIEKATIELRDLPADTDAARRDEVTQRRAMLIREFQETEKTMRYACEVPVAMEGRLGLFAKALQKGLGK